MKKIMDILYKILSSYKRYFIIAILAILLVILSYINYTTSKYDVINSIQQENLSLLDGAIVFFQNYICERQCDLEDWSKFSTQDISIFNSQLASLYEKHPDRLSMITYIDSNGNYLASIPKRDLKNIYEDYGTEFKSFVEKSKQTKESVVSNFLKIENNKIGIAIITPMFDSTSSTILGFLVGVFDCSTIGKETMYTNFSNTNNTIFGIDKNGIRVFSLHDKYVGENVIEWTYASQNDIAVQNYKNMTAGRQIIGEHYSMLNPNKYNSVLENASKRFIVAKPIMINGEFKFSLAITTPYSNTRQFDGFMFRQLVLFLLLILIILYTFFILLNDHIYNKKLEKTLLESQESERIKTEFFSNMSHELRTPLTVILSALHIIYKKYQSNIENNEELKKVYYKMKQNCLRLLKIVNNLLDISKIDSEFFELYLTNVNIIDFTERISLSVVPYAEQKNIELLFDTEIEEKIVAVDEDGVEKILLNLLSNAIKFTPQDGQILINVRCDNNYVVISVKDTGIGIPKEKKDIIFKKFTQLDSSLRRCSEGSGLGLSIVKSLVELHHGKIEVLSDSRKGSEFIVYLPDITTNNKSNIDKSHLTSEFINRINIEFSDIQ